MNIGIDFDGVLFDDVNVIVFVVSTFTMDKLLHPLKILFSVNVFPDK